MKIGGRAYKNGVRLVGDNYTVKAYYENNQLKYTIGKKNLKNNKWFVLLKKVPVVRGMISLIFSLFSFFKEATGKPKRFWPILFLLTIDIGLELYFRLMPESSRQLLATIPTLNPIIYPILLVSLAFLLRQTLLKETFKFHGAEHKAVNYYESEFENSLASHSRLARRCGTNLVVFYLVIINLLGITGIEFNIYLESLLAIGLAYEGILIAPKPLLAISYLIQRFTTIEPDSKHLKASQTALDILLAKEKSITS